jgi:hypothetical protein
MAVADFAQGVTDSNYWAAHLNSLKPQPKSAVAASANTDKPLITAGADGKSFFENVLDIVNPLEHLPIVSTIYHALTGNQSGDVEKVAGDTLYGGVIGLASSVADLAFEKITGKDFGDTMLSMVGLGGDDSGKNTVLAANTAKAPDTETAATAALNTASLTSNARITPVAMPFMPSVIAPLATPAQLTAPATVAPATASPATVAPATAAPRTLASANATPATATASAQTPVDISPQTDALLEALQKNGITGPMQAQALDAYRRSMAMRPTYTN